MSKLNWTPACGPEGIQRWGKDEESSGKKKRHSLRLATPNDTASFSPSLQQATMMAGAEEGRDAILSTHKRGQQLWEPFTHSLEGSRKTSPA